MWGAGRVGMHLAPRGDAHDMGDSDPAATFGYVARELGKRGIAFICARELLKEPRLGPGSRRRSAAPTSPTRASRGDGREALAAGEADAVAFGKLFIANPDLPRRFGSAPPLNAWNAETFYGPGPEGYIDYAELAEAAE